MTPEQQQIAIARACGWTAESGAMRYDGKDVPWTVWGKDGKHYSDCPDYLNDLNACHEMEKVLTGDDHSKYLYHLADTVYYDGIQEMSIAMVSATAAQRAEAFLRTLNLWND